MSALSKKYKINYKRRYTISKNKKPRGHKSIKVYHNRVKRPTRKRKHYMGGDIKVPAINSIFPSGQTYQPNTDCLEKECDKKDDAGEMTTTCLNTHIVMNLFRQKLDASEGTTMDRIINDKLTNEERNQVKDLTEKYLSNYVDSLFSRSIFSKNNVDLTLENTQKLKELLKVINQEYIDYLIDDSNLSDDIKQTIRATQEELNVVDNATMPAPVVSTTPAPATIDNAVVEAEAAKKAAEDAEAERLQLETAKKAAEDAETERLRVEAAKKVAEDAEAERVRVEVAKKAAEAEQAQITAANEIKVAKQTKENAVNIAKQTKEKAINLAKQTRENAVNEANKQLDINLKDPKISAVIRNFRHNSAIQNAENEERRSITRANRAEKKAIAKANTAEKGALDVVNQKISAKKNLVSSQILNNP